MAAATMDRLRQLYGQPRDAYAGTTPPVVATPRDPARLLHYCVAGDVVLATIDDAGTLRLLRLQSADHPELARLGDRDRATLQGAVLALRRQRGVHDAA
ncbi:MAG: hypothetical protein IPK27_03245 [Rhodanobacteraceae bacterium]|nr:hypothetical protein [Rhodanobacteraceae bacterium]